MNEVQIWILMYLSVGMISYWNDCRDGEHKSFGIVFWPFCIILSMVNFK